MKKLINISIIILGFTTISFAQNLKDQNPNFQKSLKKYEQKSDMAINHQSITVQETYEVKDWRDVKAEQKELKAERRHELRKMRIERDAQNRRIYNYNNCRRYNRNRYPYYNY